MDDPEMAPGSSASHQVGDGKPPDITRKVTACVACRKQKIKCHMRDTGQPCTRCKKRGLSCTVNRSLQMILESDAAWKSAMEQKICRLESAVSRMTNQMCIPRLVEGAGADDTEHRQHSMLETAQPSTCTSGATAPSTCTSRDTTHNFEIVMDLDSGPAAIPGSVVSPVSNARETIRAEQDIVSQGVITAEEAQSFLDVYQDRLDHFLYSILGDRRTLQQMRFSSPFLLAAISAVGALHQNSSRFDALSKHFVSTAGSLSFSRHCTLDDIRALCIGAFWLSSISWVCIGAAVRLCSELQLHRSIFKALQGDQHHYRRTRLYYLVYVCDHHFSVAYGRPPMTREDNAISSSAQFLELELCTQDDSRLVSQVQFWVVGSEVYQTFGIDVDKPLDSSMIVSLRRLNIKLDEVRADWTEAFTVNQYVGNYPKKGVGLHYHFARLYLCSMAFRGIGQPGFKGNDIALDIEEIANTAILSATTILRTVVSDTEIQSYLNGLPTYFDVMIAFAVVFLVKISTRHTSTARIDVAEMHSLVAGLVNVLQIVTASMHPRHLLVSVARGANDLLKQWTHVETQHTASAPQDISALVANADGHEDFATIWPDISFDEFMGEFDFLAGLETWNTQLEQQYQ